MYTLKDTLKILNLDDIVSVYPTSFKKIYDWDSIFDTMNKIPNTGSIKKNHQFQFLDASIDTCTMITKVVENSTVSQIQQLLKISKGSTIDDRNTIIINPKP